MGDNAPANDDGSLVMGDVLELLKEIERLRCEIAQQETKLAELTLLAHSDPLLGLPNRRSFVACLERLIARVDQHDVQASMILADVDGLKMINDRHGHNAGDKALAEISGLLVASVRKDDCVARFAGDEFAILLENTDELSAWQMALRVAETVNEHPFQLDRVCLPLSVAVGVAPIWRGDTPDAVIARADREMYRIKRIRPSIR
jgi:diguanylate cyclase (GGDEF)-like protein